MKLRDNLRRFALWSPHQRRAAAAVSAPGGVHAALPGVGAHPIAVGAIALITAILALPTIDMVQVRGVLGDGLAPRAVVVATTAIFAAGVGHVALRMSTPWRARIWLAFGAASAGVIAMWVSYAGASLARGTRMELDVATQVGACFSIGGTLGFLFGTGFAPIVMVARRALAAPSHDGQDRVTFAAGVSLAVAAAVRALLCTSTADTTARAALVAGGLVAGLAAARIVRRILLVTRARRGVLPGFHVVPAAPSTDDAELLPLVRLGPRPTGVLAVTGVSAPYRGARGIFKLGLVPLVDERFDRPIAALVRAGFAEGAASLATLVIGAGIAMGTAPIVCVLCFAAAPFRFG